MTAGTWLTCLEPLTVTLTAVLILRAAARADMAAAGL